MIELEKFRAAGHDLAEILDKSTVNEWTDVYAPRAAQQSRASPSKPEKFDPLAYVNSNFGRGGQTHERTIEFNEFGEPV